MFEDMIEKYTKDAMDNMAQKQKEIMVKRINFAIEFQVKGHKVVVSSMNPDMLFEGVEFIKKNKDKLSPVTPNEDFKQWLKNEKIKAKKRWKTPREEE